MTSVLTFLLSLYIAVAFIAWPFMWATRTSREDAPINRRLQSLILALMWPFALAGRFLR
ncbi:hypothetical protein C8N24_3703 [Solirubrobacter pauli]|uniref:Uncharacterized protein n=1 Tax=Solirubrobacter pauli TaxID=166793 RepID=A0A660LGP1_9ACTN|nr:hypothetical protein [Solirubrobacter pauli]RKQ93829.1 hypothetical protein C8N24_3703 [Solirubrobacter pauli]